MNNEVRATGSAPFLEWMRVTMRDTRINLQRWIFRRNAERKKRKDSIRMAEAILNADEQSRRIGRRLWVLKVGYSDYAVVTKQQVRNFFNSIGMPCNYHQVNEYIIHITKKTNE